MRILHVLSANFFAGSVSYAIHLANTHQAQGHQVWLASDAAELPTAATCVQVPINDRRHAQRWRNIRQLRQLVRAHQIEVVHAHSRAASWVSYFALLGLRVPLVSTIHGRQHLHASTSLFDIYGDRVVAICANLRTHLIEEVKMQPEKITLLPNGVGPADFSGPPPPAAPLRLALIGRFNGGKGERAAELLQHVFPVLLQEFPTLRVALIGGELDHLPAAGKTALAALQRQFQARLEVVGFTQNVPGWLRHSTLVIGAGRVAIEAVGTGTPVLALGEAFYAGPVTEATYEAAAASNFGDISARVQPTTLNTAALLADARAGLAHPQPIAESLQQRVRQDYDLTRVAAEMLQLYRSARMQKAVPAWIPVLMYHKIPLAPLETKHRIFVTKENFEKHLRFFQQRGFTTLTFRDYLAFAHGERDLVDFPRRPLILTFDDGYLDNYTNLLPLMQQYGFRGVLYLLGDPAVRYNQWDLTTDPTEPRGELMTEEQRHAFVAAGWEIGAHTQSHPNLTTLPLATATREIQTSKTALEQALRTEVVSFAYPYGALNDALKQAVRAAGFAFGVATDTGGLHLEDDRFQVFRINVFPEDTPTKLRKKTATWYRGYIRRKRGK